MTTIAFSSSAQTLRGWRAEEDFSISLSPSPESVGEDSSIAPTVNDITYAARTVTVTALKSDVVVASPLGARPITFASDTPAICAVDAIGHVARVDNGSCIVSVTGQTGTRKSTQAITTSGASTIYDAVTGIVSGSLRAYLQDQQIAALAGVTPGTAAQRAHISPVEPGFTLTGGPVNEANFLRAQAQAGFDPLPLDALDEVLAGLGGIAQWKAWISPHHFLTWRGHASSDGATWRSILGEIIVEYSATEWTGTLCKLLPADWRDYAPAVLDNLGTELCVWARLYNTYDVPGDKRWVMPVRFGEINPFTDSRLAYQKTLSGVMATGGDSGSPVFCGVNGDLVMLSHATTYSFVGGMAYADYITEINAAMAELNASGTYTVQTVDLSGFNIYP